MEALKKTWYRVFQTGMDIGSRLLRWRKPVLVEGENSTEIIPELFKKHGVDRVMVVTGRRVGSSLAPAILRGLENAGLEYELFSEVEANPSSDTVYKIRDRYLSTDCRGFLAIGGGSPMDAAKAADALCACPKKSLDDLAGLFKVRRTLPLFVAVPTTAGTGSETTMAAVITDSASHRKYAIMDISLVPRYAVLDPELTRGLPPDITAATGMDALTHAVEAYICRSNNTKESILCAEDAVCTVFDSLERAFRDGGDMQARSRMLTAAFKAGVAFSRAGVGNVHAIAHTLGGLYNTPHGLANAVILPIVLEDYGKAVYKKLARLSVLTGTKSDGTDEEKAKAFIAEIRAMNQRMGIPTSLNVIREEDIPTMTQWALREANPTYPVPVIYDPARCARVIRRIGNLQSAER